MFSKILPRKSRFGLLALTAVAALCVADARSQNADPRQAQRSDNSERNDLKDWINGPVRYLAVKDEAKAFKALDNDDSRVLFIERFWGRRDPSPDTLTNEYRQLFWERVREANSQFMDSSKSGWLTDRGKIHILYGPPTEIQEDIHLRTEGVTGGGHGIIRWIYEGRPQNRSDLDAIVVVPFVRDGSGEYRVSYEPNLSSVFFDAYAIRSADDSIGDRMRAENMGGGRSPLSVMLDLGKMQEVPPQEQVLLERVETAETYRTEPIVVATDRFLNADRGKTVLVITADITATEAERPAIIARLTPLHVEGKPRYLGEDSFRIEELDGQRLAQGRLLVDPGSYSLTVMVADAVRVATGMHQSTVEVQPPSDRLRFSDILWADDLQSLQYRALASYDEPYIIGPFRVRPRLDPNFRRGETVRLFYEVYGTQGQLTVTYQLEGLDIDGSWVGLGQPSQAPQSGVSQAWELPTSERWPEGSYRIRVEVRDEQGRMITALPEFSLLAATTD